MRKKTRRQSVTECQLHEARDGSMILRFKLEDGTRGKMEPQMFAGLIDTLQRVIAEREAMEAVLEAKGLTPKEKH
jgi:hypothetical protein